MRARGFTFVELVVVLVLVGIVAVFLAPRFMGRIPYDIAGFQQETAAGLRYAQKYAFASGCPIRATVLAGGFELRRSVTCDNGDFSVLLEHPSRSGGYSVAAPSGVTLSPVGSFSFLGNGSASTTVTITLSSSAGSRQVAVIGPTGYVDTGS